ncbi:DUF1934 domain-containing protein [Intestinimonas sp. MSJ-38]|uniref:DUF1934 domain-containing protein n=1 Tax=Intestinimonas sp. MSJ-38 TaxID=2841532 RepID=UPI001C1167AA|nr:DUF1934 domain-containing protein [Intestinimonas sp. MSJ-38]MBU5431511.1 DUF1934 domain-containing protein [Intestinimonas sp. MSJ-38]
MSRDVTIFLRSSQRYPQQEPEEMELTVHGKLYFRGGCFFVSYEESAMTGMEGTRTTLKVEPGRVEIIRTGKNHSRLCFQEGLRHESPYRTPYGLLQLATVTHSLTSRMGQDGGALSIRYQVELDGQLASENHLQIEVRP